MDPDSQALGLQKALRQDLTLGGAVALLIFFAFAMQCMSTMAVVRRETGGWKWPILQFAYMGVLAYAARSSHSRDRVAHSVPDSLGKG